MLALRMWKDDHTEKSIVQATMKDWINKYSQQLQLVFPNSEWDLFIYLHCRGLQDKANESDRGFHNPAVYMLCFKTKERYKQLEG